MAEQFNPGAQQGARPTAKVEHNVHRDTKADFVGMSVAQFREKYSRPWSIAPDAKFMKGKEQLSETYVIQPNDEISIHKNMGEKGAR